MLQKVRFWQNRPIINEEYLKTIKNSGEKVLIYSWNLNSFAAIKALYQKLDDKTYVLYDQRDLSFLNLCPIAWTIIIQIQTGQSLKKDFEKEMNQMFMNQIEQVARNAPETKLDPNLKDMKGTRIALSSLKGKCSTDVLGICLWRKCRGKYKSEALYKTTKKEVLKYTR